jgi:hypothetical protein
MLQPIFKASSTAITSDAVALTADRILYVMVDGLILLEGEEWHHGSSGATGIPRRYHGLTPTVYYCKTPDLTAATIESTCIFGTDWLEGLVGLSTEVLMLERLSQTSASQGDDKQASMSRVMEQRRQVMEASMRQTRDMWVGNMETLLQRRLALGPRVRRESAWSGYKNEAHSENALTGTGV